MLAVLSAGASAPGVPEAPVPAQAPVPAPTPADPPPAAPAPVCREEVAELATFTTPMSNCSVSASSKIAEVVRRTDAAYEGLIRPGDRLMANNQWVAWIDTQDSPGIVRGLRGVDADANFGASPQPEIAPDSGQEHSSPSAGGVQHHCPLRVPRVCTSRYGSVGTHGAAPDQSAPRRLPVHRPQRRRCRRRHREPSGPLRGRSERQLLHAARQHGSTTAGLPHLRDDHVCRA